jgi:molybdopterin molybdotransferase
MIAFYEALAIALNEISSMKVEKLPLHGVLGRILAQDICSDIDMPPFDKSAMDGYACRRKDLANPLSLVGEIPAGASPSRAIGKNECMKIMTGAMLPPNADYVMMKEDAIETPEGKISCTREGSNSNICYLGEDCHVNDLLLKKGQKLKPQHVAVLATAGISQVPVFEIPGVIVLSTGNELVEPMVKPGFSQIRNSNGPQLVAQLAAMNIPAEYAGIVPDNYARLKEILSYAISNFKLILISGGVSVGDYDFVPGVLKDLGMETLFHGMRAKPGKHLLFGRKGQSYIFGMPGNPVSSFVQFEILVKPFLLHQMGCVEPVKKMQMPLGIDYNRKKTDTIFFIPVRISEAGTVGPIEYHGSAHIQSYTQAEGILEIPEGTGELNEGAMVYVRPL